MIVYAGNMNTARFQKKQMPMLGGFLTVTTFPISISGTAISGAPLERSIAIKKRFTFNFENMLPDHYDDWYEELSASGWREIEYEEERGSFSKYVVGLVGNPRHLKLKTNGQWVYSQASFVLEEV